MEDPARHYWQMRLAEVAKALEDNNFEAFVVQSAQEAGTLVLEQILPALNVGSVSWGGSQTFVASGLYKALKARDDLEVLDTFDRDLGDDERIEMRRRSLLVDLFITGTNALTEEGMLVNLDMIGNRVAALTFGPKHVVVMVGRNKIVNDEDDAMFRIKDYAAPVNAMRLDMKTPCTKTGYCEDCQSPQRICNNWTITEKAFPKGRIKVILINADLGI